MKDKIVNFIKKETVLAAAVVLAIISMFFVPPSAMYIDYIDWRVLGILLSLMIVMAGFQKNGLFDLIGRKLLEKTKNTIQLSLVLVFLCFFLSMLITNDVALITFVPFSMITLRESKQEKLLIPVIVMQTLAANLGSMLTPIGNPQNLYLFNLANMSLQDFVLCMLPYTAISGILLVIGIFIFCNSKSEIKMDTVSEPERQKGGKRKNVVYIILFLLCLLAVARVLAYYEVLIVVLAAVYLMDSKVLKKVDYCLLLTFIAFFIFTGNMGNVSVIKEALQQLVEGRELGVGILASQFISNVPAALLLSGFTTNYRALLEGVNIGGLGTLIASMASLISYKLYAQQYNEKKGKYFLCFTVANIVFLMILVAAAVLLQ